jgi:hypothetical protein
MPSQSDPTAQTLLGHLTDTKGAHELSDLTVDGVPADVALAAQYAPLTSGHLYHPQHFVGYIGSPAIGITSGLPRVTHWALDQTTAEAVTSTARVPDGVSTIDVYLWHMKLGAATDAGVTLGAAVNRLSVGTAIPSTDGVNNDAINISATGQNVVRRTLAFSGMAVSPGQILVLRFYRLPAAAFDVLAEDYGVIGMELVTNPT